LHTERIRHDNADWMKTLQLQLRFLIPLLVALVIAALVVLPLMDQLTLR
jgi:hypothetical protein